MNIYNETGFIGIVLQGMTTDITGSLFMTLFVIVTLIVVVMLMFKIPLEFQAVVISPFLIALMAYTQEFLAVGGVTLIFLAVVFARAISR